MPIVNVFLYAVIALVALLAYETLNEYRIIVQRCNRQLQQIAADKTASQSAYPIRSGHPAAHFLDIGNESSRPEAKQIEYNLPTRVQKNERADQAEEQFDCA
jgi:hypothetical protein